MGIMPELKKYGFSLSESDLETLEKLSLLINEKQPKYSEYLEKCFDHIITHHQKVFEFDEGLIERSVKSMVTLRKQIFNNRRVLELRDNNGIDIEERLIQMIGATIGDLLYVKKTEEEE